MRTKLSVSVQWQVQKENGGVSERNEGRCKHVKFNKRNIKNDSNIYLITYGEIY